MKYILLVLLKIFLSNVLCLTGFKVWKLTVISKCITSIGFVNELLWKALVYSLKKNVNH